MIEILKYTPMDKGLMIGKFDILIPKWGNFFMRDVVLLKKENSKWISFPSRKYLVNGSEKFLSLYGFREDKMFKSFQKQVMNSLDIYLNNKGFSV